MAAASQRNTAALGTSKPPSRASTPANTLPSAAERLPFEVLVTIFAFRIRQPPALWDYSAPAPPKPAPKPKGKGKTKGKDAPVKPRIPLPARQWELLLLSKSFRRALEPVFYSMVSLTSTAALAHFDRTLKERPDLHRKVKSLWIAPNSLESDFITALKPPADGLGSPPSEVSAPLLHIRQILRSCRSLRHLGLDGCLCTAQAAKSFGTNCQPLSLLSINPYSFLGGFSAPVFRKVKRLEMCDTSLASEEVEQVRRLPELRHFVWTSPRPYCDTRRDVHSLFRIVTPSIPPSHLQLSVASSDTDAGATSTPPGSALEQPLPVKPSQHRPLQSVTIRTSQSRGAQLGTSLKVAVEEQAERMREQQSLGIVAEGGGGDAQGGEDDEDERQLVDAVASSFSISVPFQSSIRAFQAGSNEPQGTYVDSSAHMATIHHASSGVTLQTRPFIFALDPQNDAEFSFGLSSDGTTDGKPITAEGFGSNDSQYQQLQEQRLMRLLDEGESIVDEWECLRDLICGSRSTALLESMRRRNRKRMRDRLRAYMKAKAIRHGQGQGQDGEEGSDDEADAEDTEEQADGEVLDDNVRELQPGMALRRLWVEWCERVESGEYDWAVEDDSETDSHHGRKEPLLRT